MGTTAPARVHGAAEPVSAAGSSGIRATTAERKLVTVLFADIVNSSALVTGRDPEDADQALLSILDVLTGAIGRYGGTIAQMLGDGVLAVFGAPAALEDHALRACLTAQDIANMARGESGFQVRVGIATGEVVAHVIENGLWTDYRTVGESVHLAAKLQQRAAPNTTLISRETAELVPVGLTVEPAGTLQLAPGAPAFPAFHLVSVRAARRTAADVVSAKAGPFVGRRRELEVLRAALESAVDGVGTTVVLRGEAGIGKSRLVAELLRGCRHRLVHWPQAPIRRLGEPEDLETVAATLAALAGSPDAAAMAAERAGGSLAGAAVRDLLGRPVADAVWRGLQPAERLPFAIEGLAAAVVELARDEPVILLVEDVHWASPLMVRLLDTLAPLLGPARVLLLATSRPQTGTGWTAEGHDGALRLTLDALPSDKTQEFLDRWLGRHPSLSDLKTLVAAKSQGVPLYLEESLRALEAGRAIVGTPGDYRPGAAAHTIDLPASVHGLLAARIDALGAEARRTLLSAAVVGPTFDAGLLRELAPVAGAALAERLADLEEAGLITRTRLLPNLEYSFRHALIQEVAYGTIIRSERRALHARIVTALRARRDHDLPGRIDLLAHHAFRAEDWTAAYAFGRRAGERAVLRSRLVDASHHYANASTALERLDATRRNTRRQIDLSIAMGRVLLPRGLTGVDDRLSRAQRLALEIDDPVRFARAASVQAAFEWTHGDVDTAIRLSRDGIAAIEQRDCPETRVPLLLRLGGILGEKGLFSEACDVLRQARQQISPDRQSAAYWGTVVPMVVADSQLTRSLAELGEARAAIEAGMEAVEIADESGHAFSKVYANGHFGWALLLLDETERSVPVLENALALCELARSDLHHPFIVGALGYAHVASGNRDRGLELLRASVDVYARGVSKVWAQQIYIWSAEAHLLAGNADRAVAEASHAWQLSRDAKRMGYEARAATAYAEAAMAARRPDVDVVRLLKDTETTARRLSMRLLAERCANDLARQARQRGLVAAVDRPA
ncbi:MAG TPA: adenylate/guanylate cyclase domain-containing protein [Azospirillum sp.]|nr:adenylate/guanylate cyclase domain-containing protein [Azospirillum sp.]